MTMRVWFNPPETETISGALLTGDQSNDMGGDVQHFKCDCWMWRGIPLKF